MLITIKNFQKITLLWIIIINSNMVFTINENKKVENFSNDFSKILEQLMQQPGEQETIKNKEEAEKQRIKEEKKKLFPAKKINFENFQIDRKNIKKGELFDKTIESIMKLISEVLKGENWIDAFDESDPEDLRKHRIIIYKFFLLIKTLIQDPLSCMNYKKSSEDDKKKNFSLTAQYIDLIKDENNKNNTILGKNYLQYYYFLKLMDDFNSGNFVNLDSLKFDKFLTTQEQISEESKKRILGQNIAHAQITQLLIIQYLEEMIQIYGEDVKVYFSANDNQGKVILYNLQDKNNDIKVDTKFSPNIPWNNNSSQTIPSYDKLMGDILYDIFNLNSFAKVLQLYSEVNQMSPNNNFTNFNCGKDENKNLSLKEIKKFFNDLNKNLNYGDGKNKTAQISSENLLGYSLLGTYFNLNEQYKKIAQAELLLPCLLNFFENNKTNFLKNIDLRLTSYELDQDEKTMTEIMQGGFVDEFGEEILQINSKEKFKLMELYQIITKKEMYKIIKESRLPNYTNNQIEEMIEKDIKEGKTLQNNFLELLGIKNPQTELNLCPNTNAMLNSTENETNTMIKKINDAYEKNKKKEENINVDNKTEKTDKPQQKDDSQTVIALSEYEKKNQNNKDQSTMETGGKSIIIVYLGIFVATFLGFFYKLGWYPKNNKQQPLKSDPEYPNMDINNKLKN